LFHESMAVDDAAGVPHLYRLYRRLGDRARLVALYRRQLSEAERASESAAATAGSGDAQHDQQVIGPLHAPLGALQLALGQLADADTHLRAALAHAPDDLVARAALVALHRRTGSHAELASALRELIPLLVTEAARVSAWRELGRLAHERLADAATAQQAFE